MSFARNILGVLGTRLLMIMLSMIGGIIVARMLGPGNRGMLEILSTLPMLVVSFGNLGIGNANLYFIAKNKFPVESIIANTIGISTLLGSLLLLLSFLLVWSLSNSVFRDIPVMFSIIAFAPIPLMLFQRYSEYIFLGKELIGLRNRLNILPAISYLLLVLILVVVMHKDVNGVLVAQLTSSIIASFLGIILLKRLSRIRFKLDWQLFKKSVSYGIVPFFALVILNLNFKADIFLIKYFLDNVQVGYYSLGVSLSEKIWLVPEAISLVLFSRVSNIDKEEANRLTPKLCRITLLFSALSAIILFLVGREVIVLLYGAAFEPSVIPFKILLPGIVAMTLFLLVHSDLTGRGKAKITFFIFSCALFLNVLLNVMLIPRFGISGAAFASSVSYSIGALWLCFFFAKETGLRIQDILIFKREDYYSHIAPAINMFFKY